MEKEELKIRLKRRLGMGMKIMLIVMEIISRDDMAWSTEDRKENAQIRTWL